MSESSNNTRDFPLAAGPNFRLGLVAALPLSSTSGVFPTSLLILLALFTPIFTSTSAALRLDLPSIHRHVLIILAAKWCSLQLRRCIEIRRFHRLGWQHHLLLSIFHFWQCCPWRSHRLLWFHSINGCDRWHGICWKAKSIFFPSMRCGFLAKVGGIGSW